MRLFRRDADPNSHKPAPAPANRTDGRPGLSGVGQRESVMGMTTAGLPDNDRGCASRAMSAYSGIILAGVDGTRLASLTRRLTGDDRPKQFCRLLGDDTLLEQTRRRARMLIAPERLLTVVTRHHERFYRPALAAARHVFQPCPESLAVLPVSGVTWTDLGHPARVHEARARLGWEPATA